MASSFWGGFANNLGSGLAQQQQRQEVAKDWEWKAKKTQEMEDSLRKTRKNDKPEVFKKGDQYFIQYFNLDNEPLGQPVPATQGMVDKYIREEEAFKLDKQKAEAAIDNDKSTSEWRRAETGTISAREKRADAEAVSMASARAAQAGASNASAYESFQRGSQQELINEAMRNDPSLLKTLKGRGGATAEDKPVDYKAAVDLAKSLAADDADLEQNLVMYAAEVMTDHPDYTHAQLQLELVKKAGELKRGGGTATAPIKGINYDGVVEQMRQGN